MKTKKPGIQSHAGQNLPEEDDIQSEEKSSLKTAATGFQRMWAAWFSTTGGCGTNILAATILPVNPRHTKEWPSEGCELQNCTAFFARAVFF